MRDTAPKRLSMKRLAARFAAILFAGMALTCSPALADSPAPPSTVTASQTRTLPWNGGDRLSVAVAAEVDYVPGPSAKVVITGPGDLIRDIVAEDGVIRYPGVAPWRWFGWWGAWGGSPQSIKIVVTAPHLSAAHLSGSGRLNLGRLVQDRLDLSVSGSGLASVSGAIRSLHLAVSGSGGAKVPALVASDVTASLSGSGWLAVAGTADTLALRISGSGRADMAALRLQDIRAGLSGSGSASVAPNRSAELSVSGSGSIRLLANPTQMNAHRSGSGRIVRLDGTEAAPRS